MAPLESVVDSVEEVRPMFRSGGWSGRRLRAKLLAAAAVICAATLVWQLYVSARSSFVRDLLCPFSTDAQWDQMVEARSIVITGGPIHGRVRMYCDVAGRSSWWVYDYERVVGWPSSTSVPRSLLDQASVVAAADLTMFAPTARFHRQLVVAEVREGEDEVRQVLLEAGWEPVSGEAMALFGLSEDLTVMVPGDGDEEGYEGVAFRADGGGDARLSWSRTVGGPGAAEVGEVSAATGP